MAVITVFLVDCVEFYMEDIKVEATPLTNDELLIMSHRMCGFVLRDRTWGRS